MLQLTNVIQADESRRANQTRDLTARALEAKIYMLSPNFPSGQK